MDVEAIYSAIKDRKGEKLSTDVFDVNVRDTDGNGLLHIAAISNDVKTSKVLMNQGAVYNIKNKDGKTPLHVANGDEIKHLYRSVRMFFKAVKKHQFDKVSKYVMEEKFLVNVKEENAGAALHWSVTKNNNDVVELLLENDTNVLQVTDEGNTALHIAVHKGSVKTIKLLLKGVPEEKLSEFINFKTLETKSTCLHISAENGDFEIVKILLKHGAIYNMQNNTGDTPCNVAIDIVIEKFLKQIDEIFSSAKDGDKKSFTELNHMNFSELEAIMNARDISNNTVRQVLELCGRTNLADTIAKTLTQKDNKILEWTLNELENLEYYVYVHSSCSETYLQLLSAYSRPSTSGKNGSPWKTLKEGSYFLKNAYTLVSYYKAIRPGPIEDTNMKIIDDTLQKLQFHPSHISSGYTMEAYGGKAQCFVSKAQGTEYYYKLLHNDLVKDVRVFMEMVVKHINIPVEKFLVTVKEKCLLFPTHRLKTVIENNSESEVLRCIEKEADVNFVYDNEETPLIRAVKCGFLKILVILLENGADVYKNSEGGNTLLHIAVSNMPVFKDSKPNSPLELTQCLLKYGAKFNCKNKDGRTPLNVSKFVDTTALLRKVHDCFSYAEDDNPAILRWLRLMNNDEFQAVTKSRNADGHTLLQLAISREHKSIEKAILVILLSKRTSTEGLKNIQSPNVAEAMFERKLDKMKNLSEKYLQSSKIHLPELKALVDEDNSKINSCPRKTLTEGSFYLLSAYKLVHAYRNTLPILTEDPNIERINNTLNDLQFNSEHISSFYSDVKDNGHPFISTAEGTEVYYRLLNSNYKKHIKEFLEIVEEKIDIPAKMFIESLYQIKKCTIL